MLDWLTFFRHLFPRRPPLPPEAEEASARAGDEESGWPNWPRGKMPHSRNLSNTPLYRFQPKKYLTPDDHWHRMFRDLDHKWAGPYRFAGKDVSPGHFFSIDPAGALAEWKAYGSDIETAELLDLSMSLDNLLDLTDQDALKWFFERHFDVESIHWAVALDSFLAQQHGGDGFDTFAGHMALIDGYKGLIFFGARACQKHWDRPGELMFASHGAGPYRDINLVSLEYDEMKADANCINVVIFFGHDVVRGARRINFGTSRAPSRRTIVNSLFEASYPEIDAAFARDPTKPNVDLRYETLRARSESVKWLTKPSIDLGADR